jgi:hypothetical protein
MGEIPNKMKKGMETGPTISLRGSSKYTKQSRNSSRKFKHSIKIDMTNTGLIISSGLETRYGFTSTRRD